MTRNVDTASAETGNGIATRRLKILVVDDESDLADLAAELLAYHGMDTLVAYSADEALQLLELHRDVNAVFSDVMMPAMTGFDLAAKVARLYPAIRIVLTSGFTALNYWNSRDRRFRFIGKPYSIDAVIPLLNC